jgi:hypothetical protein
MQLSSASSAGRAKSPRKSAIHRLNDEIAPERERWLQRAAFFHREDLLYLKFLIPPSLRILELGCGTGHLLAALDAELSCIAPFLA